MDKQERIEHDIDALLDQAVSYFNKNLGVDLSPARDDIKGDLLTAALPEAGHLDVAVIKNAIRPHLVAGLKAERRGWRRVDPEPYLDAFVIRLKRLKWRGMPPPTAAEEEYAERVERPPLSRKPRTGPDIDAGKVGLAALAVLLLAALYFFPWATLAVLLAAAASALLVLAVRTGSLVLGLTGAAALLLLLVLAGNRYDWAVWPFSAGEPEAVMVSVNQEAASAELIERLEGAEKRLESHDQAANKLRLMQEQNQALANRLEGRLKELEGRLQKADPAAVPQAAAKAQPAEPKARAQAKPVRRPALRRAAYARGTCVVTDKSRPGVRTIIIPGCLPAR